MWGHEACNASQKVLRQDGSKLSKALHLAVQTALPTALDFVALYHDPNSTEIHHRAPQLAVAAERGELFVSWDDVAAALGQQERQRIQVVSKLSQHLLAVLSS